MLWAACPGLADARWIVESISWMIRPKEEGRPRRLMARALRQVLAGFSKSENLPSYSLGKVDKSELMFVEKVVVPALVDDPHEVVLRRLRIGYDSIDLAKN